MLKNLKINENASTKCINECTLTRTHTRLGNTTVLSTQLQMNFQGRHIRISVKQANMFCLLVVMVSMYGDMVSLPIYMRTTVQSLHSLCVTSLLFHYRFSILLQLYALLWTVEMKIKRASTQPHNISHFLSALFLYCVHKYDENRSLLNHFFLYISHLPFIRKRILSV